MKTLNALLVATGLLTGSALADSIHFDDGKPGQAPAGWVVTKTGQGEAKWTVEADDSAPSKPYVMKQSGEADLPGLPQEWHEPQNAPSACPWVSRVSAGWPSGLCRYQTTPHPCDWRAASVDRVVSAIQPEAQTNTSLAQPSSMRTGGEEVRGKGIPRCDRWAVPCSGQTGPRSAVLHQLQGIRIEH
jgi:hypothetical protein